MQKINTHRLVELSLLTAIALTIFSVELHIPNPVPIPGIKLGLANIITVYAIYRYRSTEVLMIVVVRIFLGSIFSGNVASIIYSLAGGLLCLIGMVFLTKIISEKHMWINSILGAILHNIGQITVAMFVLNTTAIIAYLPILIISACITGAFTGFCAQFVVARLGIINKTVSSE